MAFQGNKDQTNQNNGANESPVSSSSRITVTRVERLPTGDLIVTVRERIIRVIKLNVTLRYTQKKRNALENTGTPVEAHQNEDTTSAHAPGGPAFIFRRAVITLTASTVRYRTFFVRLPESLKKKFATKCGMKKP